MQNQLIDMIRQLNMKNNYCGLSEGDFLSAEKEINNLFKNERLRKAN